MNFKNIYKNNSVLKRIGKNFSIGVAGSFLMLLLSLISTALLTKNLPVADYGRVLVVLNFFGFMTMLFGLRVNDFVYRFYPRFKDRNEHAELKGIIFISFILSIVVGLVVSLGAYVASSWVAEYFYSDQTYGPLLRIYALAAFFMAFDGFHISILRLHDKFAFIVIPQVAGGAISLAIITISIFSYKTLTVEITIWAKTIGALVSALPALLFSFFYIKPIISKTRGFGLSSLKTHKKLIVSTLFQTNLTGYLKLGSDTGGLFLLGLLANPTQVALYGIARQLSKVLQIMQSNVQNAITPEIVSLWAQNKINQLYSLIGAYTKWSLLGGAAFAILTVLLAKPVILIFTTPEYLAALPIFYIFIFTIYMTFVSLVFFPLALAMDKLGRRNFVVSIRFIYLLIGTVIGLNGMVLAIVQLLGALTTRLFNDIPLLKNLQHLAKNHA